MPCSCGVFFIFHSLLQIIACFDNIVNRYNKKCYSKNAEFLLPILCKTYTNILGDFPRELFWGETKNALCHSFNALTEGVFFTLFQIAAESFRIFHRLLILYRRICALSCHQRILRFLRCQTYKSHKSRSMFFHLFLLSLYLSSFLNARCDIVSHRRLRSHLLTIQTLRHHKRFYFRVDL